jgi:hypothetical protein
MMSVTWTVAGTVTVALEGICNLCCSDSCDDKGNNGKDED